MTTSPESKPSVDQDMIIGIVVAILILGWFWISRNWIRVKEYSIYEAPIYLGLTLLFFIVISILGYLIYRRVVFMRKVRDEKAIRNEEEWITKKVESHKNLISKLKSELFWIDLRGKKYLKGKNTSKRRSKLHEVVGKFNNSKYINQLKLFDILQEYKRSYLEEIEKIDKYLSNEEVSRREKIEVIEKKLSKGFFRSSELNEEEKSVAFERGFRKVKAIGLNLKDEREFIIKPRGSAGEEHFVLNHLVAEYIKKYDPNVRITYSQDADVIFNAKGQEWAIEIETGSIIRDKNKFENKIELLNNKYRDKWMIVVTDTNQIRKYHKLIELVYSRNTICEKISSLFFSQS